MTNIQEAKTHLSRLVDRASSGEEIIIAKAGKPLAKLVPYATDRKPRVGGWLRGQGWEAEDAWDQDDEMIHSMTNDPIFPEEAESNESNSQSH